MSLLSIRRNGCQSAIRNPDESDAPIRRSRQETLLKKATMKNILIALFVCLPIPPATAADHFDVASVKPAEMPKPIRRHSPGRIAYEGIGLAELITKAFALPQYQVVWPDWVWGVPLDTAAARTLS